MHDPAIEAVRRSIPPAARVIERQAALDAAREALKPIREIHRPVLPPGIERCKNCDVPWPCETAKLIYPESEL